MADAAGGERLVFLHGFTQTHHHWRRCALAIGRRLGDPPLALVDLPGHGLSGASRQELVDSGAALVELAGRGTYVGYSMGGRFALATALARWGDVERLVLIGATPGIDDAEERHTRLQADRRLADRIERIGVEAFVDEWLARPLFASLPRERAGVEQRLRNTVEGLAFSLRWNGTGNQAPLWPMLERVPIPVLALAGERDEKFTAIGARMAEALPNGEFRSIPGAGHAAHAEQPEATAEIIAHWIAATPRFADP